MWQRLLAIIVKEIQQLRRDRGGGPAGDDGLARVVDGVDHQAEAGPVGAVEAEAEPGEVDVVVVGDLGRRRLGGLDAAARHDVGELVVEAFELLVGREFPEADHERPVDEAPEPHFRRLADLASDLGLAGLSMGMSADFETAIRCGATHIRVGSAIFGERPAPV